jgi:hypothetical protein
LFSRFLFIAFAAVCLCLTGCSTAHNPAGKPLAQMTFDHLQLIPINVGALKSHTDDGDFASESFVVSPYDAIESYLRARFAPAGTHGTLEAAIEDASIKHSYEPSKNKAARWMDVAGNDAYDMLVKVRLTHRDETGQVLYTTVLTGRRIARVNEHASIAEREKRQLEALETMFADLDREILRIVLKDMNLGNMPAVPVTPVMQQPVDSGY